MIKENIESILALKLFLESIIVSPGDFVGNEYLMSSLQSQGALSKIKWEQPKIIPTSINTLKRLANRYIERGFGELDNLRLAALDGLVRVRSINDKGTKNTKVNLLERISILEIENQMLMQDLWQISMAFEKSLSQGKYYASKGKENSLIELCRKEQNDLRAIFLMAKTKLFAVGQ